MVTGENVAKQQHHPDLREGGHTRAQDPHPSPRYALGKVLPWNAQQMADSLLPQPTLLRASEARLTGALSNWKKARRVATNAY